MKIGRRFTSPCNKVCKRGAGKQVLSGLREWHRHGLGAGERLANGGSCYGAGWRCARRVLAAWRVRGPCLREWHRHGLGAGERLANGSMRPIESLRGSNPSLYPGWGASRVSSASALVWKRRPLQTACGSVALE